MTICPAGAELFHVDGQTDRHNEANRFCNFVKAPKSVVPLHTMKANRGSKFMIPIILISA